MPEPAAPDSAARERARPETSRPSRSGAGSRMSRAWVLVRQHPVTVLVVVAGTITGSVVAYYLPIGSEDMSPLAKILGGALLGAWISMFPLGFRLYD